jgi:hypothetical protein
MSFDDGKFRCEVCEEYLFGTPQMLPNAKIACLACYEIELDMDGILGVDPSSVYLCPLCARTLVRNPNEICWHCAETDTAAKEGVA